MVVSLLHGTLDVMIYRIDDLHHRCGFNLCSQGKEPAGRRVQTQLTRLWLPCVEAVCPRLYATVDLDKARLARTRTRRTPKWFESFHLYSCHSISNVIFTVKEDQSVSASLIGRAYLGVKELLSGQPVDEWLEILDEDHAPIQGGSKIHVRVQFTDVRRDPNWSQGIRDPRFGGVPYVYFNQREYCKVTLYQDAQVAEEFKPEIPSSEGKDYKPQRCWEHVFEAIWNAKYLIYITGWSVYTNITLIRDPKRPSKHGGGNMTLGDLLKKKAEEGVRVLMLVWDDRSSVDIFKAHGFMLTHDQETFDYFRGTKVHCVLCPRNPDEGKSFVQGFQVGVMFTHHQKTLVVDAQMPGSYKRRIVSFVGGIDLCDGRYDTQEHPLFRTLGTLHYHDFHQPNFAGSDIKKGGPREPWHDIHCMLEGPIAWDVLYNFEQRWLKQGGRSTRHLIPMAKLQELVVLPSPAVQRDDPERWTVQLFRSIDGGAVEGFPEDPREASSVGLISGKDNIIDRSIHDAYVHAIRRAKNFIYIENQYFVGSSFGWRPAGDVNINDINALNLIPKELSLKIVSKIEAGERFAVYIVIPMWPEGEPASQSVQAILDWQRRTIEMMYADIATAIRKKGIRTHPRDYLSFFCLGNRESKRPGEYVPPQKPEPDSDYARAQESRRFMIYVHSKMMIVDDEYIIIGSANINQRSMDGARDSEIAMGGFQPEHLATEGGARGQIFGFRNSLWYEHVGSLHPSFLHPESESCIRIVNALADNLWDYYSDKGFDNDLPGHLLSYPIVVESNGEISNLPEETLFPDTRAKVLGEKSTLLPPILTT